MRPIIQVIVLLSAFLLLSPSSYADGNQLLKECAGVERYLDTGNPDNQGNDVGSGHCFGLVEGVTATLDLMAREKICFPKSGYTNGQGVRVVLSYLRNNPAELHQNHSALVIWAFIEAYPCK